MKKEARIRMRWFFIASLIFAILACILAGVREVVSIHNLTQNLNNSDAGVRYHAIRQLRRSWRATAALFVPTLISIVRNDEDVGNAWEALAALSEIAPDDDRVDLLLHDLLNDKEEKKRAGACSAFGARKGLPDDLAKKLARMAHVDPSALVRISCAWTLHQHGVFKAGTARDVMSHAISSPGVSSETKAIGERVLNGIP
jgi:hypothetical protein